MKLSDLGHRPTISASISRISSEESRDEYRGMKVFEFEMNKYELDVARAAIRMLHRHHDFFYHMEMSTEASLGKIMESLIAEGIEKIESTEKMMEEMQHESML